MSRILLPIEARNCPVEAFSLVNGMANRSQLAVILLEVLNLNVLLPERRVYDELSAETHVSLRRLADTYLPPSSLVETHVRFGEPAKEILSEAKAENVDVIVLPNHGPSFWQRLRFVWKSCSNPMFSALVERVMREAECDVLITNEKNCFDHSKLRTLSGETAATPFSRAVRPAEALASAQDLACPRRSADHAFRFNFSSGV